MNAILMQFKSFHSHEEIRSVTSLFHNEAVQGLAGLQTATYYNDGATNLGFTLVFDSEENTNAAFETLHPIVTSTDIVDELVLFSKGTAMSLPAGGSL